jgi:hypothetical protein
MNLRKLWHRWRTRGIRARVRRDLEAGAIPWDRVHTLHRQLGRLDALTIHAKSEHNRQLVRELVREHWELSAELAELCRLAGLGIRPDGPRTQRTPRKKGWVFGQQDDREEEEEPTIGGVRFTRISPP